MSELSFDESGAITGIDREIQVTDNEFVNWAPFWHSDGRSLVYATSEEGHYNYEIYIVDADPGDLEEGRPTRYGTRRARVTNSRGFDGLPAFNDDSSLMIGTTAYDGLLKRPTYSELPGSTDPPGAQDQPGSLNPSNLKTTPRLDRIKHLTRRSESCSAGFVGNMHSL